MNETLRRILSYVLVFIVGAGIATGAGYYFIVGPSQSRARQLTDELRDAISIDREIADGLTEAARLTQSSTDSVTRLRALLGAIQKAEQMARANSNRVISNSGE